MLQMLIKMLFPQYKGKHHKTVRYAFSFMFMILLSAGLAAVLSSNSSYVKIGTSKESVAREEVFYIDVSAYAHVPINAVDIVLDYSENTMKILSIDTGTSVITLWTQDPYADSGKIFLRGGTFRQGFIGEHTIARIKAQAIKTGSAKVLVEGTQFIAGDGDGTVVDTTSDGTIVISVSGSEDGVLSVEASVGVVTDTDGDGDVDLSDISIFMTAWLRKDKTFDFNGDGRMTFIDFSILLAESFFN